MAAALVKIAANSPSRAQPSELETSIATAIYDLETNIPDMKGYLRPLQFVSAREVGWVFFLLFYEEIFLGDWVTGHVRERCMNLLDAFVRDMKKNMTDMEKRMGLKP